MNLSNLRRLLGEATPGPWSIRHEKEWAPDGSGRVNIYYLVDANGEDIEEIYNKADAQLIVEAINSIEGLLEICEAAIEAEPASELTKLKAVINKHLDKE